MDDNNYRDEGLHDEVKASAQGMSNVAENAANLYKNARAKNAATAGNVARTATKASGAGAAGSGAAAAKGTADGATNAARSANAAHEAQAATQGAAQGAGKATATVSKAGGWVGLIVSAVIRTATDEKAKIGLGILVIFGPLLGVALLALISGTRANISSDPIERSVYSVLDEDYAEYPSAEEAIRQAIDAINQGIAQSYKKTLNDIKRDMAGYGLHEGESFSATDFTGIERIQYNPFRILSAWQVANGAKSYEPDKLREAMANAKLFPYAFQATQTKIHQNLYKPQGTPVASINGIAFDEPIDVPAYTMEYNYETGTMERMEIDWASISVGQDWHVVSYNGETVTIGNPVEVKYAPVSITRFDEKAALRAVGYDEDSIGDDLIEPDYEMSAEDRMRATEATYFDNFREVWILSEQFYADEMSNITTELKDGGYKVETNITEEEKQTLLANLDKLLETYEGVQDLAGSTEADFYQLIINVKNFFRPYVYKIRRYEPEAEPIERVIQSIKDKKEEIEGWSTVENTETGAERAIQESMSRQGNMPDGMFLFRLLHYHKPDGVVQRDEHQTVTADELKETADYFIELREIGHNVIMRRTQRDKIFEATKESINIIDGTHLMSLDAYIDPGSGDMVIQEYGEQSNVQLQVSGEMSEEERSIRQRIIDNALSYLGTPYGTGRGQIDCSLLSKNVYQNVLGGNGLSLNRTAAEQGRYCDTAGVTISSASLRPGDLIFFAYQKNGAYVRPNRYKKISHVAIYAGEGKVIEASYKQGKVMYRNNNLAGAVSYGAPLYALSDLSSAAVKLKENPSNIKNLDKYGVLAKGDIMSGKVVSHKTVNVRYYCGCGKCGYGTGAVGEAAMSQAAATSYFLTSESDPVSNDPMSTVFEMDGTLYKVKKYNMGENTSDGDTIMVYASTHREAVQKNYDKETKTITIYRYGVS